MRQYVSELTVTNTTDGKKSNVQSLVAQTVDAAPAVMTLTGVDGRIDILPSSSLGLLILIGARQTAGAAGTVGDSALFWLTAILKRDAANNTTLIGGANNLVESDAAAAAWTAIATADDINEALTVTVTGELNKTVDWEATVIISEIG